MRKIKTFLYHFIITFVLLTNLLSPGYVLASPTPSGNSGLGCGGGMGPFADALCGIFSKPATSKDPPAVIQVGNMFNTLISSVISILITVAGLWFLLQFIVAGYAHISAGGDKSKLQTARDRMLNSLEGILIVVAAYIIALLVGQIVGFDILNPGKILQNIGLKP